MFNRGIALAAVAALSLMAPSPSVAYGFEPRPRSRDIPPDLKRAARRSWAAKGRGGKKAGWGRYKGSPSAKKASRRGGNPARF